MVVACFPHCVMFFYFWFSVLWLSDSFLTRPKIQPCIIGYNCIHHQIFHFRGATGQPSPHKETSFKVTGPGPEKRPRTDFRPRKSHQLPCLLTWMSIKWKLSCHLIMTSPFLDLPKSALPNSQPALGCHAPTLLLVTALYSHYFIEYNNDKLIMA